MFSILAGVKCENCLHCDTKQFNKVFVVKPVSVLNVFYPFKGILYKCTKLQNTRLFMIHVCFYLSFIFPFLYSFCFRWCLSNWHLWWEWSGHFLSGVNQQGKDAMLTHRISFIHSLMVSDRCQENMWGSISQHFQKRTSNNVLRHQIICVCNRRRSLMIRR